MRFVCLYMLYIVLMDSLGGGKQFEKNSIALSKSYNQLGCELWLGQYP
jgi:hypothetical protein